MRNFTIIRNELLEKSQLSVVERYLLCVLIKHCGQNDTCFPTQRLLAENLGVTERYIRKLLSKLEADGLIKSKRQGFAKSNLYTIAKEYKVDRNGSSHHVGSLFPLHKGTFVPTKNTQGISKDKKDRTFRKGMESIEEVMQRSGIRAKLASKVKN